MASFKSTYPELFATPLDVRLLSNHLRTTAAKLPDEEREMVLVSDIAIMKHILDATSIVRMFLQQRYGGTLLASAPYFSPALPGAENQRPHGAWNLGGVTVGANATTEQWTVRFTSTTAFSVTGSISGAQGSGTTGEDFTATDEDIVIDSTFWNITDAAPTPEDVIYFSTYKHDMTVVILAAKLACAHVLKAMFSEVSPNEMAPANALEKEAMDLLKLLVDEKSGVTLSSVATSLRLNILYRYDVDLFGEDTTEYESETGDQYPTHVDDWDTNYGG